MEGQKKEELKPVEVEGVEEWEVEKILNKKKVQGIEKYLVCWKGFMVEYNTWEREENLGNRREAVKEFEGRMSAKVRKQEKLDRIGNFSLKGKSYQESIWQGCCMDGMMESLRRNI